MNNSTNESIPVTVTGEQKARMVIPPTFSGVHATFVIAGIVCDGIINLDYDDTTQKGFIDYRLSSEDIENAIYLSPSSEEIDVYFDNGISKFKLEIDGVGYEGTTMNVNPETPILQRRMYFIFSTSTFGTYNEEDTPWYKEQHELAEV